MFTYTMTYTQYSVLYDIMQILEVTTKSILWEDLSKLVRVNSDQFFFHFINTNRKFMDVIMY